MAGLLTRPDACAVEVRLADFLRRATTLPFVYGARDCALWPCDWVELVKGLDPARHLRGTYDTALSCARVLRGGGGLMRIAEACAARAGLPPCSLWPAAGDIACLTMDGREFLSIATGTGFAAKAPRGVTFMRAGTVPLLAAWSIR